MQIAVRLIVFKQQSQTISNCQECAHLVVTIVIKLLHTPLLVCFIVIGMNDNKLNTHQLELDLKFQKTYK